MNGQGNSLAVNGTLLAEGTVAQPIQFSSILVDLHATSGASRISRTTFTGQGPCACLTTRCCAFPDVLITDASPLVTNNTFQDAAQAVWARGVTLGVTTAPTISNNTITTTDLGIVFQGSAQGTASGNTVGFKLQGNNGRVGIYVEGDASPAITGNTVLDDPNHNDTGISLNVSAASAVQVASNDVCSTGSDVPLALAPGFYANTQLAQVSNNTFSCGMAQGFTLNGTIAANSTLRSINGQSSLRLTGGITVNSGIQLTIPAGATVEGQGNTLVVSGTLLAEGTVAQPIRFNNTLVDLRAGSGASRVSRSMFTGQGPCACLTTRCCAFPDVLITDASPLVTNNTFQDAAQAVWARGVTLGVTTAPTISNNTITTTDLGIVFQGSAQGTASGNTVGFKLQGNNGRVGIYVEGDASPAITGNTVLDDPNHNDTGISLNVSAASAVQVASNDICSTGSDVPLALAPGFYANTQLAQVSNNTFSCGMAQGFTLNGTIATNSTLRSINGQSSLRLTGGITVNSGIQLTIPAGTTVEGQGNTLGVSGTLLAEGSVAQPIRFNNTLVDLRAGSDASRLSRSMFTGQGPCACLTTRCCAFPDVLITDASPLVTNNTFQDAAQAVWARGVTLGVTTAPTISNNTITTTDLGIVFQGSAQGTASGNTVGFKQPGTNGRVGIYVEGDASPAITGNTVLDDPNHNDTGISLNVSAASAVQVASNDICSTGSDVPLALAPGFYANTQLAQVSNNTFSCGMAQGFTLSGTIATNSTLRSINGQSSLRLTGGITVNSGIQLTIPAGATVEGQGNTLVVSGTLLAEGTVAQPIRFNNTLVDLRAGSGASRVSRSMFAGQGPCACLTTRCCAFPDVLITDASPLVTNNTFQDAAQAVWARGVTLGVTTAPTISNNTITTTDLGIVFQGSAQGTASGNTVGFKLPGTNGRVGIYVEGDASPAITGNTVLDDPNHNDTGISLNVSAASAVQVASNDICSTGSDVPLALAPGFYANTQLAQVSNNTFSCGMAQGFTLNGTIATNSTLRSINGQSSLRLSGAITVNSGIQLTIPAGTTVEGQGNTLGVSGTLLAEGSVAQPIRFNNTLVDLRAGSDASRVSRSIFAGQGPCACLTTRCCAFPDVLITDASPLVTNNTFQDAAQAVWARGVTLGVTTAPTISNNAITTTDLGLVFQGSAHGTASGNTVGFKLPGTNGRVGIYVEGDASPAINGNTVLDDPNRIDTGIFLNVSVLSAVQVTNNDICSTASDVPLNLAPGVFGDAMLAQVTGNVFSCGLATGFNIPTGTVSSNSTLIMIGGQTAYQLAGGLTVGAGARLSIPAGTTVNGRNQTLRVDGTLAAANVAFNNVVFDFRAGSDASLLKDSMLSGPSSVSGISVNGGSPTIMGSQLSGMTAGVTVNSGSPSLTGNSFIGLPNAVVLNGATSMVIDGNLFSSNSTAIRYATAAAVTTVSNNTFDENNASLAFNNANTLFSAFPAAFDTNDFIGAANENTVPLPGTLDVSGTLRRLKVAYAAGGLTIPVGTSVVVEPGAVIQSSNFAAITVNGQLVGLGLPDAPIVFTSTSAKTGVRWAGMTVNTQAAATRSVLDSCIIEFAGAGGNSALRLSNASINVTNSLISDNAGAGIELINSSNASIMDSSIVMNLGDGIRAASGSNPVIRLNSIFGNGGNGVNKQDCLAANNLIDAQNNFWGDDSGPRDASDDRAGGGLFNLGTGDEVSNCVDYDPWIRLGPTVEGTLTGISGGGQSGTVNTCLPAPFVVEVLSTLAAPLQGIQVIFSVVQGDASIVESQPIATGADGRAAAHVCLGSTPGEIVIAVTARDVNSPLATFMPTAEPSSPCLFLTTALSAPNRPCAGDCNGDGSVTVNELITGVDIALGDAAMGVCPSLDRGGDGEVTIDELLSAVDHAVQGCPTVGESTVESQG